jgi:Tol biopolymer transport system component
LTVHGGALFGHRLDLSTLTIAGEPVHLADDVAENTANGRAGFSVAQTGVLVVARRRASDLEFTLDWYDRAGKHLAHVTNAAVIGMSLSPDGKRLAYHRHDESGGGDIWIADLDRGGTGMRFTFDVAEDALSPVWSPDGKDIAFSARRNGKWGLFRKAANLVGSEELLFESDQVKIPAAWALDGRSMLIVTYDRVGADIGILPLSGDRTSVPYAKSPLFESFPAFSPDGRWIAYRHSTTAGGGSGEIYVNSYPAPGTRFQPSTGPATQPQWRADGKELFYLDSVSGVIFSVSVDRTGEGLQFGPPHKLFDLQISGPGGHPPAGTNYYNYLVSSDGQKFLIPRAQGTGTGNAAKLTVILNWQELARE